jgi:hypothetical protein
MPESPGGSVPVHERAVEVVRDVLPSDFRRWEEATRYRSPGRETALVRTVVNALHSAGLLAPQDTTEER